MTGMSRKTRLKLGLKLWDTIGDITNDSFKDRLWIFNRETGEFYKDRHFSAKYAKKLCKKLNELETE